MHAFITDELKNCDPDEEATLNLRFLKSGVPFIGTQNVFEVATSSSDSRFWLCKSCLTCDSTLDTAESHVYSREHIHNSLVKFGSSFYI